jgi:hypothetical protein
MGSLGLAVLCWLGVSSGVTKEVDCVCGWSCVVGGVWLSDKGGWLCVVGGVWLIVCG